MQFLTIALAALTLGTQVLSAPVAPQNSALMKRDSVISIIIAQANEVKNDVSSNLDDICTSPLPPTLSTHHIPY